MNEDIKNTNIKMLELLDNFKQENRFSIWCYRRISTDKQDLERQKHILENLGYIDKTNCNYIDEVYTGTDTKRPVLDKLIEVLNPGDTLICESLSRLSRGGIVKTLELITYLIQVKKVNVIIIKENFHLKAGEKPDANTNLLLGIFSVLGQFERDLISERTKEALQARKNNGVKLGRQKNIKYNNKNNFIYVLDLQINQNHSVNESLKLSRFPRKSFYNKLNYYYNKYENITKEKILNDLKEGIIKW